MTSWLFIWRRPVSIPFITWEGKMTASLWHNMYISRKTLFGIWWLDGDKGDKRNCTVFGEGSDYHWDDVIFLSFWEFWAVLELSIVVRRLLFGLGPLFSTSASSSSLELSSSADAELSRDIFWRALSLSSPLNSCCTCIRRPLAVDLWLPDDSNSPWSPKFSVPIRDWWTCSMDLKYLTV